MHVNRLEGVGQAEASIPVSAARTRLGAFAIVAVIVIQVTVPLFVLLLPPPQRFGFQMYSGYGGVTAIIRDSSGDEAVIDNLDDVVANLRTDISWVDLLPEAICAARPAVVEVTVEQSARSRSTICD